MSSPEGLVEKAGLFLLELASVTNSGVGLHVWSRKLGRSLKYDDSSTDKIVSYLKGESHIAGNESSFHLKHHDGELIALTSHGVTFLTKKNSTAISNGNTYVTNNIVTNNIGSIINSHFEQIFNDPQAFRTSLEKLLEFTQKIREQVKENKIEDTALESDIANLENEIKKPNTNWQRIRGWVNIVMQKLPLVTSSAIAIEKISELAQSLFGLS